jgi:hypothetical protein
VHSSHFRLNVSQRQVILVWMRFQRVALTDREGLLLPFCKEPPKGVTSKYVYHPYSYHHSNKTGPCRRKKFLQSVTFN